MERNLEFFVDLAPKRTYPVEPTLSVIHSRGSAVLNSSATKILTDKQIDYVRLGIDRDRNTGIIVACEPHDRGATKLSLTAKNTSIIGNAKRYFEAGLGLDLSVKRRRRYLLVWLEEIEGFEFDWHADLDEKIPGEDFVVRKPAARRKPRSSKVESPEPSEDSPWTTAAMMQHPVAVRT